MVVQAVLILFSKGVIPRDKSWKACRILMGSIDGFLSALRNYDKENIHPEIVKAIQPYITNKGNEKPINYQNQNSVILHENRIDIERARALLSRPLKSLKYTLHVTIRLRSGGYILKITRGSGTLQLGEEHYGVSLYQREREALKSRARSSERRDEGRYGQTAYTENPSRGEFPSISRCICLENQTKT